MQGYDVCGVSARSAVQRQIYVMLQSIYISTEATRDSNMQPWTLLLSYYFYFNIVIMVILTLAHDVSGSGSCVTRHEFVVAQKKNKMKSLCFSRQLLTAPAEGEDCITQDFMEEKNFFCYFSLMFL